MKTIVENTVATEVLLRDISPQSFYDHPIAYKTPHSASIYRLTKMHSDGKWQFIMVIKLNNYEKWTTKPRQTPQLCIEKLMTEDRLIHIFEDEEEFLRWALGVIKSSKDLRENQKE